jgi:DNA-binding HxlR family transcriptional regulator
MDKSVVDQYLAEVPYQVRLAVKPLSNDKSWAILIALLKDGDMRFSNIKRKFGADSSGDIDRILKQLIQSGLIMKQATNYDEIFDNAKSIYSATPIGAAVIHSLNRALSPSFNHTFMDNMQSQQIAPRASMHMEIGAPGNLKGSVQAHIPSSYKVIINKSPAIYGKNDHIIANKEPIPV